MEEYAQLEHDAGWVRKTFLQLGDRRTIPSIGNIVKVKIWIAKGQRARRSRMPSSMSAIYVLTSRR